MDNERSTGSEMTAAAWERLVARAAAALHPVPPATPRPPPPDRDGGLNAGTATTYRRHLGRLDAWLAGRELTDELLAEFLAWWCEGKTARPADKIKAAVAWRARLQLERSPAGPATENTIREIRRRAAERPVRQVDPVRWEEVDRLVALAAAEGTIEGLRDAALIRLMSDALLRPAEAVGIDVDDVDPGRGVLLIRRSKADQLARGATAYLGPPTVSAWRTWLEVSGITSGPAFRPVHGDDVLPVRLTTNQLRAMVQDRARAAGIPGRVRGHSFRVGSAQSLAERGASLVEVMRCGRWSSSDMPARYVRGHEADRGAVARLRYPLHRTAD